MKEIISEIDFLKENKKFNNENNILILGANSFILSYFLIYVIKYKKFKNLYLFTSNKNNFIKKYELFNFDYKKIKFFSYKSLNNWKTEVDLIIHASSPASPNFFERNYKDIYINNIFYTNLLIKISKKFDTRIIFFSSGEVYGNYNDYKLIKKNQLCISDPYSVRSLYPDSKRLAETILYSASVIDNLKIDILRIFHTYGPFIKLNDQRIFSLIINSLLNKKTLILNNPSPMRCYCYILDFTDALIKIISNKTNSFDVYDCANVNEEYSNIDLLKNLSDEFSNENFKFKLDNKNKSIKYSILRARPNISKIKKLGWSPHINIKKGFRKTLNFYLDK